MFAKFERAFAFIMLREPGAQTKRSSEALQVGVNPLAHKQEKTENPVRMQGFLVVVQSGIQTQVHRGQRQGKIQTQVQRCERQGKIHLKPPDNALHRRFSFWLLNFHVAHFPAPVTPVKKTTNKS